MNLIFDFGGVLVTLDKERVIRNYAKLGFDITPYIGVYRQAGIFSRLESGTITVPELCEEVRRLADEKHRSRLTNEAIVEIWQSYLIEIPTERLRTLERLHRQHKLYILSNTNEIHWRMGIEKFFRADGKTFEDYFDGAFLSYKLHMEKPQPELYRHVLQTLGSDGADCMFFDDSQVNCEAAIAAGLPACLAPADGSWMKHFDEEGNLWT